MCCLASSFVFGGFLMFDSVCVVYKRVWVRCMSSEQ